MVAEIFGVDGVIVLIVVLAVLFGGTQIPKLARSLGSAKAEFERGLREREAPTEEPPTSSDQVTMTRAELDALIAEREAQARDRNPHAPA